MTSSDFFTDPYTMISYPWEYEVLKDWLIQYYRFLATSPEVVNSIRERKEEFEMVPVPKTLSRQLFQLGMNEKLSPLGSSDFVPDMFSALSQSKKYAAGSDERLKAKVHSLEKLKHYPVLVDLVREFGQKLETGNIENLMKLVADDYVDYSGRSKEVLEDNLKDLFKNSFDRRIILVHARDFDIVDNMIVANISGAWEGRIGKNDQLSSEFFNLEMMFSKDKDGEWKINSIKHEQ